MVYDHRNADEHRAAAVRTPLALSFYDLPAVLRWITCNIGYHHIHHLSPRIPNYYLRAAHEATALENVRRMDVRASFACARMKLWDEDLGRMVGFPRRAAGT